MADEPRGLATKLWHVSLTILGAVFALWLSVRLLTQIWWVLVVIGGLVVVVVVTVRWRQWHRW